MYFLPDWGFNRKRPTVVSGGPVVDGAVTRKRPRFDPPSAISDESDESLDVTTSGKLNEFFD